MPSRSAAFLALLPIFAAPLHGQTWERWSLIPDLRIGSIDAGDDALDVVSGLAIGADGSIHVLQPQSLHIRVFDRHGRFARTIGREGGGPGEFRSLGAIGLHGERLWVSDLVQYRLTSFDREGRPAEIVTINGPMLPGISTRPTAPAVLAADGTLLGLPLTSGRDDISAVPIVRMDREGRLVETIGTLRHEPPIAVQGGTGSRSFVHLFRPPVPQSGLWGVSPGDGSIVIVDRPAATSAVNARFHVSRLRSARDTVFSRSYSYPPRPLPPAVTDSIVARLTESVPSGMSRGEFARLLRERLDLPRFEPPISGLLVGHDGTIWLRREHIGLDRVEWIVLDERGDRVAFFHTPPNLRLFAAQRDLAWGVETDALDVPYVVRFRVEAQRE